jgi:predicted type IV restriction endonuclease
MAAYQDKARERIAKGLRKFKIVAQKASANSAQESDTRMIVSSIVSELLGWDAFENLTGEFRIKGNYADFVIRKDDRHFMIIEVKAITAKLNDKHLYQAVSYAANQGVEWVILTNGAVWRLYRIIFSKPVDQELVFEVSLLDEEPKPREKVELLYLLTPEAQRKDELEGHYQRKRAISGGNIAKLILSEPVLTKLRAVVNSESGYKLPLDELSGVLVSSVFRPELQDGDMDKQLKRIQKAANAPKKTKAVAAVSVECVPGQV